MSNLLRDSMSAADLLVHIYQLHVSQTYKQQTF